MTHNTARNWAITLGITSTLALTGCTASNGAATPTSSDTATHSTAPPPSGGTATSTAGSTAPSTTSPAGSAAPSATQPGNSGTRASAAPDASSEPVGAPGATAAPTEPAPGDQTGETIALSETYTAPDGTYTVNYPASWTASTDKGYLELTSPDGSVTGHVSPTSLHGPDAAWTGRHVTHYKENLALALSDAVGGRVSSYSGYNSAANHANDTVGWGLTLVDMNGLVPMSVTGSDNDLWAYFEQSGVNESGKELKDKKAAQVARKAVRSKNGAAVEAILQSVQLIPDLSGETPPDGYPDVLDQTYTSPDGAFSMDYPSTWTVATDQGYLEVTSPTGQTVGRIATTDVRPLREDWFTSVRFSTPGEETALTQRLGSPVRTYSAYYQDPDSPAQDAAVFGLTQVDSGGLVSLGGSDKRRELWVEFMSRPINTTGRQLTDDEARQRLAGHVSIHQDVPAIQAMLQSIRIN